uniref:Uncharacterized protein n=1 Tax=Arundo donax TaxID=35708 RepID=A0A0A9G2K7_ARUDO
MECLKSSLTSLRKSITRSITDIGTHSKSDTSGRALNTPEGVPDALG